MPRGSRSPRSRTPSTSVGTGTTAGSIRSAPGRRGSREPTRVGSLADCILSIGAVAQHAQLLGQIVERRLVRPRPGSHEPVARISPPEDPTSRQLLESPPKPVSLHRPVAELRHHARRAGASFRRGSPEDLQGRPPGTLALEQLGDLAGTRDPTAPRKTHRAPPFPASGTAALSAWRAIGACGRTPPRPTACHDPFGGVETGPSVPSSTSSGLEIRACCGACADWAGTCAS